MTCWTLNIEVFRVCFNVAYVIEMIRMPLLSEQMSMYLKTWLLSRLFMIIIDLETFCTFVVLKRFVKSINFGSYTRTWMHITLCCLHYNIIIQKYLKCDSWLLTKCWHNDLFKIQANCGNYSLVSNFEDIIFFNEISNHKTINLKPMFLIYSVLYVQRSEYIRQHRRLNSYSLFTSLHIHFYLTVILNKKRQIQMEFSIQI